MQMFLIIATMYSANSTSLLYNEEPSRNIDISSGGWRSDEPANDLVVESCLIWSLLATAGYGLVVVFSNSKYQEWTGT